MPKISETVDPIAALKGFTATHWGPRSNGYSKQIARVYFGCPVLPEGKVGSRLLQTLTPWRRKEKSSQGGWVVGEWIHDGNDHPMYRTGKFRDQWYAVDPHTKNVSPLSRKKLIPQLAQHANQGAILAQHISFTDNLVENMGATRGKKVATFNGLRADQLFQQVGIRLDAGSMKIEHAVNPALDKRGERL
jgi:hypothetical protein